MRMRMMMMMSMMIHVTFSKFPFSYVPLDGPTVYTFQGSNNAADSKSWDDLVVVTSSAPWAENETRTHHVHKPRSERERDLI